MVNKDEVKKIAGLARLRLEGDELEKLTKDFNGILDFVAQINEVDTSQARPFDHVLDSVNIFREDKPHSVITEEDIRKIAPKTEAGYIVVPRVIETGD
ncbi:MAG: Asp-tRNA(Asn)/Glu-tRNA(Gln) amidotransferase subunit GatC [Leptospiraceae bacterium]|nr:Asp-tRNA(Asn)/Glu-tRNA(Gln) amidotransferase subunit GatC [Leptospiraceae bacterium]